MCLGQTLGFTRIEQMSSFAFSDGLCLLPELEGLGMGAVKGGSGHCTLKPTHVGTGPHGSPCLVNLSCPHATFTETY